MNAESTVSPTPKLRLGLPTGSLHEATLTLFAKAGYLISGAKRSYRPTIDDPEIEIRLLRAQEISRYVEHGFLDVGLTGRDWVEENGSEIEVLCDLPFSKATAQPTRWVLAVPEASPMHTVADLAGKRIATEAVGLTKRFLARHGVEAEVEFSWGATEVKVPDLVDAIVDITETGSSLRANNLRIVATLMESYPQLIASKEAMRDDWKRAKARRLEILLQGAINARDKVGLKMNLPENQLKTLLSNLPSLRHPTVSPLATPGWVAIETIIDEKIAREIIPQLKLLGAEGIIEYPLNKVVY
ncbi:MAG: ATP phosphoribosyltransferase [Verrucomicrobia bacterium]|nr:ATP phosphoribosyltransferase [Verrucomicrobiota bacterium]